MTIRSNELRNPGGLGAVGPDDLGATLGAACCGPPEGVIAFKGFLSPLCRCSDGETGYYRLYLDTTFWSWLEISEKDIRAQVAVPVNSYDPRSMVWVAREAIVTKCKADEAHCMQEDAFVADPAGGPNTGTGPY